MGSVYGREYLQGPRRGDRAKPEHTVDSSGRVVWQRDAPGPRKMQKPARRCRAERAKAGPAFRVSRHRAEPQVNYNTPASGFRPEKTLALRTYIFITAGEV